MSGEYVQSGHEALSGEEGSNAGVKFSKLRLACDAASGAAAAVEQG